MSGLVELDPDIYQDPDPEGYECGYGVFEQLPNVSTGRMCCIKLAQRLMK